VEEEDLFCAYCGKTAYFLCGSVIGPHATTCDAPLCRNHYHGGYCPKHAKRPLPRAPVAMPPRPDGAQFRLF